MMLMRIVKIQVLGFLQFYSKISINLSAVHLKKLEISRLVFIYNLNIWKKALSLDPEIKVKLFKKIINLNKRNRLKLRLMDCCFENLGYIPGMRKKLKKLL